MSAPGFLVGAASMKLLAVAALCSLGLLACRGEPTSREPAPAFDPAHPVMARFEPPSVAGTVGSPPELSLVLENRGARPERVHRALLAIPQVTIEVLREGQRVPPLPPPVPRPATDDDFVTLAPGETLSQKMTLTAFSPPLPAGKYRVRAVAYPGTPAQLELR